jgi:hypothetical protein
LPSGEDAGELGFVLRERDDHVAHGVFGELDGEEVVAQDVDDLEVVGLV